MVKTMAQGFSAPSARLASRLHAFATNRHESCELGMRGSQQKHEGLPHYRGRPPDDKIS
jgi:hypothetical protein